MLDVFHHHRATTKFPDWAIRDFSLSFNKFCTAMIQNDYILYSNRPEFYDYKDKTVFIVGGGPSTLTTNLDNVERDYTWSLNHFYLNEKMKNIPVDLAMILGEPKFDSLEFQEYREKYKPLLGFEVHDRWFGHTFDDYDKYFSMHTKFYGRLGGGVRMVLFAAHLGCKEIKFTGFDGPESIYDGKHAFQPGKNTLPAVYANADKKLVFQDWKEQSDFFWDYTRQLFPNTKFENLGGGEKYHERCK